MWRQRETVRWCEWWRGACGELPSLRSHQLLSEPLSRREELVDVFFSTGQLMLHIDWLRDSKYSRSLKDLMKKFRKRKKNSCAKFKEIYQQSVLFLLIFLALCTPRIGKYAQCKLSLSMQNVFIQHITKPMADQSA